MELSQDSLSWDAIYAEHLLTSLCRTPGGRSIVAAARHADSAGPDRGSCRSCWRICGAHRAAQERFCLLAAPKSWPKTCCRFESSRASFSHPSVSEHDLWQSFCFTNFPRSALCQVDLFVTSSSLWAIGTTYLYILHHPSREEFHCSATAFRCAG